MQGKARMDPARPLKEDIAREEPSGGHKYGEQFQKETMVRRAPMSHVQKKKKIAHTPKASTDALLIASSES